MKVLYKFSIKVWHVGHVQNMYQTVPHIPHILVLLHLLTGTFPGIWSLYQTVWCVGPINMCVGLDGNTQIWVATLYVRKI